VRWRLPSKKILVVDDAKTSILAASLPLKSAGYEVLVANNGRAGIVMAMAERPDLILLDVVMPEMDGLTALRELRREPATREIPIILATSRPEMLEREVLPRWDDCIAKPVKAELLLAKVRRLVG
jgi:CheY-like chemotaxis protein